MSDANSFPLTRLDDVIDILDHMRAPVNGAERLNRSGSIPYYGANGQQGWIDRPLFNEPLILLAEDGGNFDDFASRPIAYRIDGPSWINNHAHIIRANGNVSQNFIFWSIVNKDIRRYIAGGTRTKLTQSELRRIEINLPAFSEQKKIAQILDTIDTAIHETEAIIAKLKAVKQGLLHDLLTRGIDANGELRPPQAEAPQLYKESALGWIPNEWEVHGVLDVAPADRQCILTGPFGAELGQADFKEEGTPVLRIGNVQAGHIDWNNIQFVTQEKAQRLDKYRVATGDLLFARQGATTGRNALADARAHGVLINYHIIRVAVDHAKCHPTYLYALFNTASAKSQVDQSKGRGTREGINSEQIASLTFALPNPEEQNEAVERIASIDASISDESMLLEKLQLEKSGLMDDLLTGRVRVTPLLEGDSTSQTGQQLAGQMPG